MLDTDSHLRRHGRLASTVILLLGGTALAWSILWPLDGAVVTHGTVVVDGNIKKVQHQTGGIIGTLNVRDGARVTEGELLARLEDAQMRANLGVILTELTTQRARLARLVAERDDLPDARFPDDLVERAQRDADAQAAIDTETRLFLTRKLAREGQKSQLVERLAQASKDLEGLNKQRDATEEQLVIAKAEYDNLQPLRAKGLVQRPRLAQLEREIARNDGLLGDAAARIEGTRSRMREVLVQIAQVDRDRVAESSKELREIEARINELNERRIGAEDLLRRADIKAPVAGTVHELSVHTIGGVIAPGETMMLIVPHDEPVVVEARVTPNDIDQIHVDQPARVRFTSFNQRTTPELFGRVRRVSANSSRDQQTGITFFTVAISLTEGQAERLNGARIMPGMVADAFITTTPRTVMSFLLRPLLDNWQKVFAGR